MPVGAGIALLAAGRDMHACDRHLREVLAPPGVASDGQRAGCVAVIPLSARDEMPALGLADHDDVLAYPV